MKYLLPLACGLAFCVSLGSCLMCYSCNGSITMCKTNTTNCTGFGDHCYYGFGQKDKQKQYYFAGCANSSKCEGNIYEVTMNGLKYNATCCKTNLCNEGSLATMSHLLYLTPLIPWFARLL